MASVSSLDKDMRNLRMSKYTPQAANEVRSWVEASLGQPLKSGDLLDALRDGTALCKYGIPILYCEQSPNVPPGWSISQHHQQSALKNPQCLSCRWRIYHTSSAPHSPLLSIFSLMICSRQLTYTRTKILLRYSNASPPSAERPTPYNPANSPQ